MKLMLFNLDAYSASVIITVVIGIVGIVVTWILRNRTAKSENLSAEMESVKHRLNERTKELLALYKDVQALIQVEEALRQECDLSKRASRAGYTLSYRCEPKRIEKRIFELEKQLQ